MKKAVCIFLTLLVLLSASCTKQKESTPVTPAPTKATATSAPKTKSAQTEPPAESETDPVDVVATATPTVPEGMCKVCASDRGDYDGYCYYCHPDFLFTCLNCGYEQPYHRPENGLCYDCDAAQSSVDAASGATG